VKVAGGISPFAQVVPLPLETKV